MAALAIILGIMCGPSRVGARQPAFVALFEFARRQYHCEDTPSGRVFFREIQAAVVDGFLRGDDGELREPVKLRLRTD